MNHKEQLSAVEKALKLTGTISDLQTKLDSIKNQSGIKQPQPPVRETAKSQYPEIKSSVKFSWVIALVPIAVIWVLSSFAPVLGAFLLLISPAWIPVYYFLIYKPKKTADIEKIRNSNEYRQQCVAIDAETQRRQAELDKQYQAAMEEYNEIILPKYQRELEEWNKQHEQEISNIQQEIVKAKRELTEHYEKTQIVPQKYRNIKALSYISLAMTLNAGVKASVNDAIELYEEELERQANARSIDDVSLTSSSSNGGHGVLSGLAHSAINNSRNRSYSSSSRNSNSGKQSLWGTAMCPYGKKNANGFSIRCNIGCPMWTKCGGK